MAEELKTIFVNMDDKCQPTILAGILSRNVSQIYQWAQTGKILNIKESDDNYKPVTYKEVIKHLVDRLIREEEVKLAELEIKKSTQQAKVRPKFTANADGEYDESMHPLVAEKLKQNIKTEYAREAQLWQAIGIKKGEYVDFATKLATVEPFVIQIRDLLLGIVVNFPETKDYIDEGMESLYTLGVKLIEEAKVDTDRYVQEMLELKAEDVS